MSKLDLRKELKQYYTAKTKPEIVDVPPGKFLTIVGRGEPGGESYTASLNALYTVAYTLKFKEKAEGRDFTMMALEGLWWWDSPATKMVDAPPRSEWSWKSMIRVPDFVTERVVEAAKREAKAKKGFKEIDEILLETYHEGLSAQFMHVGPYSEEAVTVPKLHRFIEENGYALRPHHHEIYMSDPRRVPPEKWKTIIRQPVKKK
jgi:hypothetical protein